MAGESDESYKRFFEFSLIVCLYVKYSLAYLGGLCRHEYNEHPPDTA